MSTQVEQRDVTTRDGRTLRVHDTHPGEGDRTVVVWHHGTPNTGAPPTPLREASDRLGLRWVGHDRPGYGGSAARPGRSVADVAADMEDLADALGIDRLLVMGHSGGGPRALACAALLGDRVAATAAVSSPAPYDAEGLDFLAGMAPAGVAEHRAAVQGRAALEALDDGLDVGFTTGDQQALGGRWAWFLEVVRAATAGDPEGAVEDSLASVRPWGFDVATIASPLLLVHGEADRMVPASHSRWLAERCGPAELWLRPDDGHITAMDAGEDVLAWLGGARRPLSGGRIDPPCPRPTASSP